MRSFLIFAAVLTALYLWQKHNQATPAPVVPGKPVVASVSSSTPVPQATVSEHNWMKRSLDRAADVAHKSRAQTQQNQDP